MIYVDDVTVSAEAPTERACSEVVVAAARQMRGVIENELGGEVALPKGAVLASRPTLAASIRRQLAECVGP